MLAVNSRLQSGWKVYVAFSSQMYNVDSNLSLFFFFLLPHLTIPTLVLGVLHPAEQQMKSAHVIYRQRFLLKNNCGDRGWA